jgi:hypothetical protein
MLSNKFGVLEIIYCFNSKLDLCIFKVMIKKIDFVDLRMRQKTKQARCSGSRL